MHTALIVAHSALGTALLVAGYLTLRAPKRRRSPHPGRGRAYIALLAVTLPTGMIVGLGDPAISPFEIATPPTLALGLAGYAAVRSKPRAFLGEPWIVWHIAGMGGSYIGVVTAAAFQIVPRLAPESALVTALIWALPTIAGTALIARASARHAVTPRRAAA